MTFDSQQKIAEVCDDIKNMLIEKNMKYGDSALNPIRVMSQADSVEQIKVRIDDKLNRLSQGHIDDDEDVINDLIGYFVLLKIAKEQYDPSDFINYSYEPYDPYYEYELDNNVLGSYNTQDTLSFSNSLNYEPVSGDHFSPQELQLNQPITFG